MGQLEDRRKDAAHYCETCPYRSDSSPAAVQCDHGGIASRIIYSVGKCPIHHWDHSGKYVPTAKPKIRPIPREQWGTTLNEWIAKKIDTDTGIGDTLNRLGPIAKAILVMITPNVRCSQRVTHANALYPYDTPESP